VTVRLLPDVEALAVAHLRANSSVAALVGTRVSTELPATPQWPYLIVTLLMGVEKIPHHLDEQYVQLSAWGDTKAQANLLVRTARAALIDARSASHTRGVVTNVRTVLSPRWLPDETTGHSRPRYTCDMALTVHPHKVVPSP
jgi:hypothetical protein